jgi:nitrogen fixation protein FixH
MKNILILTAFAIFALSGCATQKTVDMAASYNAAYETHADKEAAKVASKATAIKEVLTYDCTDNTEACGVAKALSGVVASIQISGIKSEPFVLEKHATDIDAQIATVKVIGNGIPILTMGAVAVKAIDSDNGTVTNNSDNGSTVTNSYEENHSTALGEGASSNNTPDQDNSVVNPAEEETVE